MSNSTSPKSEASTEVPLVTLSKTNWAKFELAQTNHLLIWPDVVKAIKLGAMPTFDLPDPKSTAFNEANDPGGHVYKAMVQEAIRKRSRFGSEQCPSAWSHLIKYTSESVQDQLRHMVEYETNADKHDIVWLWKSLKHIATGQGAHSLGLDFVNMFKVKMEGNDYSDYFTRHRDARTRLDSRVADGPGRDLIETMCDALFLMNTNIAATPSMSNEIDTIYKSGTFPSSKKLMQEWMAMLISREAMHSLHQHADGQLKANMSKRPAPKQEQRTKRRCFNCKGDHALALCPEPHATCRKCKGKHHSDMHDEWEKYSSKSGGIPPKRTTHDDTDEETTTRRDRPVYQGRKAYSTRTGSTPDPTSYAPSEDDEYGFQEEEPLVHGLVTELQQMPINGMQLLAMSGFSPSVSDERAVLDTGCTGHIFRTSEGLTHICEAIGITVKGITDNVIIATHTGQHPVLGRVHVVPQAEATLISVPQLLKKGCRITGEGREMKIFSPSGKEIIRAVKQFDGLYTIPLSSITAMSGLVHTDRQGHGLNDQDISRAKQARALHKAQGHPGDDVMKNVLMYGLWPEMSLTGRDIDNANKLLGPCAACIEGKMVAPPEPSVPNVTATKVGEAIYVDLKQADSRTLGGNTQCLIARDKVSSYLLAIPIPHKTTGHVIEGLRSIIAFFLEHGHVVHRLVFDSERVFVSVDGLIPGIECSYTPAGMHNKTVERAIREIQEKTRAMEADLPYVLPSLLQFESFAAACAAINDLPNSTTGPTQCAYLMVTGRRPATRAFPYGQAGITYSRQNGRDPVGEWALFLGQRHNAPADLRVYIPTRCAVYSRRKFIPHDAYPEAWGFRKRLIVPLRHFPSVLDVPAPPPVDRLNMSAQQLPQDRVTVVDETAADPPMMINAPEDGPSHPSVAVDAPVNIPEVATATTPIPPPVLQPTITRSRALAPPIIEHSHGGGRDGLRHKPWGTNPKYLLADLHVAAYRLSVRQALKEGTTERQNLAREAIAAEVQQLWEMRALEPILWSKVPIRLRNRIIPSHMFLKEKYKANGEFDKMKARLVAGGDRVDTNLVGETRAPTVNPITVMIMLQIAALKSYTIMSADIKGAYLIPDVGDKDEDIQFVWIDPTITQYLVALAPSVKAHIDEKGRILMRLRKYLYGLPQAAYHFNTHLTNSMIKLNFRVAAGDKCLFIRGDGNSFVMACAHVDDLLIIGTACELNIFKDEIQNAYDINIQVGEKHSYLGLEIEKHTNGTIAVSQSGYRRCILLKYKDDIESEVNRCRTPCNDEILNESPDNTPKVDKNKYTGMVMSLMYLARYTRPDLLFATVLHATRCSNPDESHLRMVIRTLKYLKDEPNYAIEFKSSVTYRPAIYADASHGIHADAKGHGALFITLGGGCIYFRSFKLKMVTLSSTEAEHVVLSEAATMVTWIKSILESMNMPCDNVITYQDNTSTIWMTANEGNFARNKHILIRRNFVKEAVLENTILVRYKPTEFMIADMGTKPLAKTQLLRFMSASGIVPKAN